MTAVDLKQWQIDTPVHVLRGISEKRAAVLAQLGVQTLGDLVYFFPRAYEDWTEQLLFSELVDGQDQSFLAEVAHVPSLQRKGRLSIVRTVLRQDGAALGAIWFNQPWVAKQLQRGVVYQFRGRIQITGFQRSVLNPAWLPLPPGDQQTSEQPGLRPLYPLKQGLTQTVLRQAVTATLPQLERLFPESLPDQTRRASRLCARPYALWRIHQPDSRQALEIARRRLAFEELFLVQAALRVIKARRRLQPLPLNKTGPELRTRLDQLTAAWPFELTAAQRRVVAEIADDLQKPAPMNRLIQGDVGSGKTAIAACALAMTVWSGAQAVLMAPTTILAQQHYATLRELFETTSFEIGLLTGATSRAERRQLLADLASGQISLLVGTHAVLNESVKWQRLGLTITDEQHRFGVNQRLKLQQSDEPDQQVPHNLVMSATPIPRTLALVLYSDLDVSVVDELPAGRQPIATYTAREKDRSRVEAVIRRTVAEGRQAYVICPLIDAETSDLELESAIETFNHLAQTVLPDKRVGLLHGNLKSTEKEQILSEFSRGEIQVLVGTTVVEVGIDNPNATLMVIENAERFGLAQLHQLRGRVGRGALQSVCILMSDTDDPIARERLTAICQSQDGFELAEKDLALRGPGDFFGTRQHGLPEFRVANLYQDKALIQEVASSLDQLLSEDPLLEAEENRRVIRAIQERFGTSFPGLVP